MRAANGGSNIILFPRDMMPSACDLDLELLGFSFHARSRVSR
jgi:hypothetical protein